MNAEFLEVMVDNSTSTLGGSRCYFPEDRGVSSALIDGTGLETCISINLSPHSSVNDLLSRTIFTSLRSLLARGLDFTRLH